MSGISTGKTATGRKLIRRHELNLIPAPESHKFENQFDSFSHIEPLEITRPCKSQHKMETPGCAPVLAEGERRDRSHKRKPDSFGAKRAKKCSKRDADHSDAEAQKHRHEKKKKQPPEADKSESEIGLKRKKLSAPAKSPESSHKMEGHGRLNPPPPKSAFCRQLRMNSSLSRSPSRSISQSPISSQYSSIGSRDSYSQSPQAYRRRHFIRAPTSAGIYQPSETREVVEVKAKDSRRPSKWSTEDQQQQQQEAPDHRHFGLGQQESTSSNKATPNPSLAQPCAEQQEPSLSAHLEGTSRDRHQSKESKYRGEAEKSEGASLLRKRSRSRRRSKGEPEKKSRNSRDSKRYTHSRESRESPLNIDSRGHQNKDRSLSYKSRPKRTVRSGARSRSSSSCNSGRPSGSLEQTDAVSVVPSPSGAFSSSAARAGARAGRTRRPTNKRLTTLADFLTREDISDLEFEEFLPEAILIGHAVNRSLPLPAGATEALPKASPHPSEASQMPEVSTSEALPTTESRTAADRMLTQLSCRLQARLTDVETWDETGDAVDIELPPEEVCGPESDEAATAAADRATKNIVNLVSTSAAQGSLTHLKSQQRLFSSLTTPWHEIESNALEENNNGPFVTPPSRTAGMKALALTGVSARFLGPLLMKKLASKFIDEGNTSEAPEGGSRAHDSLAPFRHDIAFFHRRCLLKGLSRPAGTLPGEFLPTGRLPRPSLTSLLAHQQHPRLPTVFGELALRCSLLETDCY